MKTGTLATLLLPLLLVGASAPTAFAAVLAYDGFDTTNDYDASGGYADPSVGASNALVWDADLDAGGAIGQDPAITGFAAAGWNTYTTTNLSSSVYPRLEAQQSLTYQTASDQLLDTTQGQVSLFRSGGTSTAMKRFERALDTGPSTLYSAGDLYISGMFQFTTTIVDALFQTASTDGSSTRSFGMRVNGTTSQLELFAQSEPDLPTTATLTVGTTYLFVWHLENNGFPGSSGVFGDTLTLYLNPVDLATQAANTPVAVLGDIDSTFFVSGNSGWTLQSLIFGAAINNGNQFLFDEFRIGTTWADVTPFSIVPEPGRATLILLAAATLALRRRR